MKISFNPAPEAVIQQYSKTQIVFVHVGKCAGESILEIMSQLPTEKYQLNEFHCFDANKRIAEILDHDQPHIVYVIAKRDPVSRFVSSFNWDKHNLYLKERLSGLGQEGYDLFSTPEDLASSLSSGDSARRECAERFSKFGHMGMGQSWYTPVASVDRFPESRTYVVDTASIERDIRLVMGRLGQPISDLSWKPPRHKSDYFSEYTEAATLFQSGLSDYSRKGLQSCLRDDFSVYAEMNKFTKS